jgi:hypothetical protein
MKGVNLMSGNALLSYQEKRRANRAVIPIGTTAILKISDVLEINLVRNISSYGMLTCDVYQGKRYEVGSLLTEILINIPHAEPDTNEKNNFRIEKGEIVRSFFDENLQNYFYGIEFIHESPYIREKIARYVDQVLLADSNSIA